MGKFDGVMLVSDYDDTLYSHKLEVSEKNRAALVYFVKEGGVFTVATGRAKTTFAPQLTRERIPINAPVVLSNGSAIYDFDRDEMLYQSLLPTDCARHLEEVCAAFPQLGFESYHGEDICTFRPNQVTFDHLERVNVPYQVVERISDMPLPWTKAILQQQHPILREVQAMILSRWGDLYEAIFSNRYLLELTAKGNDKGVLTGRVADMMGIDRKHLYCIGDNQNDIPMLAISAIPFAPANCAAEVRDWGARIVSHCNDGAVAQVVGILDGMY